jgi:hypothetical protein
MQMFGLILTSSSVMRLPAFTTSGVVGNTLFILLWNSCRTSLDALSIVMSRISIADQGLLTARDVDPMITGAMSNQRVA